MNRLLSRFGSARAVVAVCASLIVLQLIVAAVSIDVLSNVRAYVAGESLYSKGQKDALLHLKDYVQSHDEADYQQFLEALTIPLGDRIAREALQRPEPDEAAARRGFLAGGNDVADIDGMIRLFRWAHDVPFMARAIAIWKEGDETIEEVRHLVDGARVHIRGGNPGAPAVREMDARTPLLNQRLSELERAFSEQLGVAARQTQRVLIGLNLAVAVILSVVGGGFVRHSMRLRQEKESEIRARKEELRSLLDSTAEGIYGVDAQGHCTFINRSALRMLGYAGEADVLGRSAHDRLHRPGGPGGTTAGSPCAMCDALRREGPEHIDGELLQRLDGSSLIVEFWSHPILRNGQIAGAVATFFDVTQRQQMKAALRERELRLSELVDAVHDGVITVDAAQNVVLFNQAAEQMFGVSADQAIGTPITRFVRHGVPSPAGDRPSAQAVPGTGIDEPVLGVRELLGLRRDGSCFPLESSLSKLIKGDSILTTLVCRDASDLHAAREERAKRVALEASNQAKNDFLSRMSHELRTPLNAVLGFSSLLRLDPDDPPSAEQLDRIRHIEIAGRHLLALVNDVLDISLVDSGKLALSIETVSLRAVVDEAVALVSPMADEARVSIRTGRSDPLRDGSAPVGRPAIGKFAKDPCVRADRVRLRQVLVNILTNAVKYNRSGGHVALSCHCEGRSCQLEVWDTGIGMTAQQLAGLFQPFNRLGAEQSPVEGVGIGLVLSRRLLESMDGQLEVESTAGMGTVVRLTLPIDESAAPSREHAEESAPAIALTGPLDVLYAEDNAVNVEIVRQILATRPQMTLRTAPDGATALRMAREAPPQVMLVDMHLGDSTGFDLARSLRADAATSGVRLVALSADALPKTIDAALSAGFEAYLTKPVDFTRLLSVLDAYAETSTHPPEAVA